VKGYVAKKGNRWYAVIYEGIDPMTGKEQRSWHPAGVERADAERLATRLASDREGRNDEVRSLTLGAYLTSRWLPGKRIALAATTYNGYRRNVDNHIVPAVGRIGLRRLRPHHLEAFYERLLHPSDGRAALAPKTVYEIHLVIRGALEDAVRRGLVTRNVALVAHAPRLRSIPKVEQKSWTAEELQAFLRAAAGHRLFPALWVSAFTGMRRNELLGLRWDDFDAKKATISINVCDIACGWMGSPRERAARSRHTRVHDRHLPARAARHASGSCARLRAARRARPSTGGREVGEDPGEAPEEERLTR